jgi:hypothetical protein
MGITGQYALPLDFLTLLILEEAASTIVFPQVPHALKSLDKSYDDI